MPDHELYFWVLSGCVVVAAAIALWRSYAPSAAPAEEPAEHVPAYERVAAEIRAEEAQDDIGVVPGSFVRAEAEPDRDPPDAA